MSTAGNKQKLIEQLRTEANINRIKVSVACKDLIKYCQDHEGNDVLYVTWDKYPIENPYKEKSVCVTL